MLQALWKNEIMLSVTSNQTYVTTPGEKIFTLPTRVLVELPSYKIVAFGQEARPVEHAGVKQARVIHHCSSVEIFDQPATVVYLRAVMQMLLGKAFLLKPKVYLSQSSQVSPFMQELWQICLYQAGAREVILVHPLLATAVGAGLPIAESHGYAVGWWDEDRLLLGLVAFGHVQQEREFALPQNQDLPGLSKDFAQSWQEFLADLPSEFRTTLSREGVVLTTAEEDPRLASALTKAADVPVTVVPRPVEVLGILRRAGAEEGVV